MPFVATIQGKSVSFDDVPMTVWAEVSKEAGVPWGDVFYAPAKDATAAILIYRALAKHLGVAVEGPITAKTMLQAFEWAKDDLPAEFEDGIPLPEADAPTTP